jgi:endonuclease/exonuclease/phosphatase family metal-dependent hydrolase
MHMGTGKRVHRVLVVVVGLLVLGLLPAEAVDLSVPPPPPPLVDGTPVCGVAGDGPRASVPARGVLRVGTYNVLHSQGESEAANLTKRLPQVLDAMEAADAHVWGLQEVTSNARHGPVAELIAEGLAARTGQTWEWCWFLSNPHAPGEPDVNEGGGGPLSDLMAELASFPDEGDFREGVAVVTNLQITDARSRRLTPRAYETVACVPPDPLGCNLPAVFDSRQVMWTRIDAGPIGGFDLFNTHLAHGLTDLSDVTKQLQVEMALATIDEWATPDALPDLFVGDFNSTSADDRYGAVISSDFLDTYLEAGKPECDPATSVGCTSGQRVLTDTPDLTTRSRIDFVFARPGSCGLASRSSSILGTNAELQPDGRWLWPSDHLGVVSSLQCDPQR